MHILRNLPVTCIAILVFAGCTAPSVHRTNAMPISTIGEVGSRTPQGTQSGGGGDPDVTEFIHLGWKFIERLLATGQMEEDSVLRKTLREIQESVDDTTKTAQIIFIPTGERLVDPHGVPKPAVFDPSLHTIFVNRDLWAKMTVPQKYRVVQLELLGLMGSDHRYSQTLRSYNLDLFAANCEVKHHILHGSAVLDFVGPAYATLTEQQIERKKRHYESQGACVDLLKLTWTYLLKVHRPLGKESEINDGFYDESFEIYKRPRSLQQISSLQKFNSIAANKVSMITKQSFPRSIFDYDELRARGDAVGDIAIYYIHETPSAFILYLGWLK